jgi:hypothetical protein
MRRLIPTMPFNLQASMNSFPIDLIDAFDGDGISGDLVFSITRCDDQIFLTF